MDAGQWLQDHADACAQTLTEELCRRVEELTLNYETRPRDPDSDVGSGHPGHTAAAPAPLGLAASNPWPSGFRCCAVCREATAGAADASRGGRARASGFRAYRAELKRDGIAPGEVYLPLHPGKALFFVVREVELLLIGVPLALWGAVNHAMPYWLVRAIARALSTDKDHWATNVIYPSLLVFPFFYLLQIGTAWFCLPAPWALLYTVAVPYSAAVALLYGDRLSATWRRLTTFVYFWRDPGRQQFLAEEGKGIIAEIRHVCAELAGVVREPKAVAGATEHP